MSQPEIGDRVSYYGRFDNVVSGILAERAISPLTGNPRYRVVDLWQEVADFDAGRWVGIEEVIGIDPPAIDVETGRTGSGLTYAQYEEHRIVRYQEGGWEQFYNVDGIGWVVADDSDIPAPIYTALCDALSIPTYQR